MLLYLWSYHYPPTLLWCTTSAALAQHASTCTTIFFYLAQIDFRLKWLLPLFSLPESGSVWCKITFFFFFLPLSFHLVSRKKGAILNISSASGMYPVPLLTVYSASKVFALHGVWPSHQVLLEGIRVGAPQLHKQFMLTYTVAFEEKSIFAFVLWIIRSHWPT